MTAMRNLSEAGMKNFKLSVVCTRTEHPAARRVQSDRRRVRRASCASPACVPPAAAPTSGTNCTRRREQQRELYDWLVLHGDEVLTGDSFFHLSAYGQALPGLNLCGAGRVVCLIDPIGDVYACPFAIHDEFLAGNVRCRRWIRHGLARLGTVRPPARAAERRGVLVVPVLRHLQGRLHGGEVLHRSAARRARPGVRAGLRRDGPRRARRRPKQAEAERRPLAPHHAAASAHRHGAGAGSPSRCGGKTSRSAPVSACAASPLAGFDPVSPT